jgi:uncharacterized protein YegP (UPF0339 family)
MFDCPRLAARAALAGLLALAFLLPAGAARAQKDTKGKLTFEVFQDRTKEFRWHLKAANNKIVAGSGEGYKNKADCKSAIENIQANIGKMKVEFFQDRTKEWRWRLKAANGRLMAVSGDGYKSKAGAKEGFELVKDGVKSAAVVEKEAK